MYLTAAELFQPTFCIGFLEGPDNFLPQPRRTSPIHQDFSLAAAAAAKICGIAQVRLLVVGETFSIAKAANFAK